MTNVVTMAGNPLMTPELLLKQLLERDDIKQLSVVVTRDDGFAEIWYTRQSIMELVFAAAQLTNVATGLVAGTIDDEE